MSESMGEGEDREALVGTIASTFVTEQFTAAEVPKVTARVLYVLLALGHPATADEVAKKYVELFDGEYNKGIVIKIYNRLRVLRRYGLVSAVKERGDGTMVKISDPSARVWGAKFAVNKQALKNWLDNYMSRLYSIIEQTARQAEKIKTLIDAMPYNIEG